MACGITGINSGTACLGNEGGIVRSYAAKLADITAVTLTGNAISNFTMATTGLWKAFVYDRDNTANINQVGSLNNNRFSVELTTFMKFKGLAQASIDAANTSKDCCDTVWIHVLGNGLKVVQGIELDASVTAGFVPSKNRSTRIVPTINSDTSANELKMEYSIAGNQDSFTPSTTLTDTAILAL